MIDPLQLNLDSFLEHLYELRVMILLCQSDEFQVLQHKPNLQDAYKPKKYYIILNNYS